VILNKRSCQSIHLWWRHFARMSDNRLFSRTTWQQKPSRSCWSLRQYWTDLNKTWNVTHLKM